MSRKHKKARIKAAQSGAAWTEACGALSGETANDDVIAWQEQHSPTEPVMVTLATAIQINVDGKTFKVVRQQQLCRRRRDDARLFESLSEKQQRAFELIGMAFRAVTQGCGWNIRSMEAIGRGTSSFSEHQLELRDHYRAWVDKCRKAGLHIGMSLDIVAFGLSCRAIDSERRVRKGTARLNLAECLDLWK